jgi:hypothetical protein
MKLIVSKLKEKLNILIRLLWDSNEKVKGARGKSE